MLHALLLACVTLAGCEAHPGARARVTVFAASSLTEAFAEIEREFERAHPGVDVSVTFAGSQVLRLQIEQGARADVFASANPSHIRALEDARLIHDIERFALNELVVIVPPENPAKIQAVEELGRAERLVIGDRHVPVGHYTDAMLDRIDRRRGGGFARDVRGSVVSREGNTRLVRAKVELGEADAAVVYKTDALASERVRSIEIPAPLNERAEYMIGLGVEERAGEHALAARFRDFVTSPRGQRVLAEHGFLTRGD